MQKNIQIPATFEEKNVIRIWTCYKHQLSDLIVDTEKYWKNIDLPPGIRPNDHESIVSAILDWKSGQDRFTVLAYQVVSRSVITYDLSEWKHASDGESKRDLATLTKKVFVSAHEAAGFISLAQLREDVSWVEREIRLPTHLRNTQELSKRGLSAYTPGAYEALWKKSDWKLTEGTKILKIGGATYILFTDEMEYRPAPSIAGVLD